MLTYQFDFEETFSCFLEKPPRFSDPQFLKKWELEFPRWVKLLIVTRSKLLQPFGFKPISANQFALTKSSDHQMTAQFEDKFFTVFLEFKWKEPEQKLYLFSRGIFHKQMGKWYYLATRPLHQKIFQTALESVAKIERDRK